MFIICLFRLPDHGIKNMPASRKQRKSRPFMVYYHIRLDRS